MGGEVVISVTGGRLDFGPWKQVFYGEFNGRRPKRVLVKIIGAQKRGHAFVLSIARQEIDPVETVLREVHPGVDTSQMGSWGIVYIICGALAG